MTLPAFKNASCLPIKQSCRRENAVRGTEPAANRTND
jgi:hypothetical protein